MERTRRHVRPPARGVRARLLAVLAATALAVLPGLTATATAAPAVDADLVPLPGHGRLPLHGEVPTA
ncbi:hypothetical protein ACWD6I_19360, partial [Streptomyces sp. NPDC002454]